MEEGARNAGLSAGVVKNRNSTGCLIVKKKVDGVGGYSGPDIVYTRKEKKRPRLVESDSESRDDELLELNRMWAGSSQVSTSGGSRVKKGIAKGSEFARKKGVDFSRDDVFTEERNSLDVYDFDEYDDLDGADKKGFFDTQGSGRIFVGAKSATRRELGTGSARPAMIKTDRKRSFLESTSGNKTIGGSSVDIKNKRKERFQSHSNEAIRLQGKNGVLKLMVKNKVGGPSIATKYEEVEGISISRSRELTQKKILNDPNSIEKMKPRNLLPSKDSEDSDAQSEESEEPAGVLLGNGKTSARPTKRGRRTEVTLSTEIQVSKSKEAKVKRGSGTEKQLLREKIRKMLVSAGWNIDYRPRRNRDYFDAVYINPAGTAYWSIIKAYDALQKQFEEEGPEAGGENTGVNLIPDDALSKLTRQTQKKLEKEMKRKNRENNLLKQKKKAASDKFVNDDSETDCTDSSSEEEKSCSFNKHSGTSKGRLHGNGRNQIGKGQEKIEKVSAASSHAFHGRKTKKIGRCTLLVRNADKGMNSEGDSFVPYKGKRTILSWLIDSGTVKLSEKVCYMNRKRTRVMLEGWITRDGIHCGCCSKIQTVSKFEIHSASKLRQPYQNICLPSGVSLLQCQVNAWNSQGDSQRTGFNTIDVDGDDPNDDTCGICGDGGNLICCDGCPSTFHQSCVGIETLPSGDWHCSHCSCKFCGLADVDTSQSEENTSVALVECSLCERKYHQACTPVMNSVCNNSSNQTSFCGRKCQELLEQLQKLLGVKHDLESGLSWSLIHRNDLDADPSHRSFSQKVEWNAKLVVASTVMDECFLPITDRRSGINLIQNVLYNCRSNFNRLNYGGFYTAILEKGDEIISAASIRIRGNQLAEMPFIGTRHIYRRQGMCRRLLVAVESALRILKVEKLVIPAISDMMHTWTKVFGFCALGESHKQEMKSLNMLVFPGTDMLQKKLVEQVTSKRGASASKGTDLCKDDSGTSPLPDFSRVSDAGTSPSETSAGDPLPHSDVSIEKSDAGFNSPNLGVSLNADCLPTLSSDVARDIQEPMECKVSKETGSSSELEDKSVKLVRDDVLEVECPSGASTHDIQASLVKVENDGHENKGASALGGSSEAVDGSTVGSPGLVSDVEKPCSLDASHNTLLMGNPVFNSPPEKKVEGASSEINDKTAKVDSSLNLKAICPTPMHPSLDESDSTWEPSAPASTLTQLVRSDGTAEPVLQLEAERDSQVKASVSSNGALTPAVCSNSKEEENTSLLCSAPDTELRSMLSVQRMTSDLINENTVEDAPGDGLTQISEG